uniref:Putative secreted protein n=1 Tax=Anopheles marajoara TaxID=58244 RepID=A0A2M4CEV0_9DIPT
MLCSFLMCSSKLTVLLSNADRLRPQMKQVFFRISSFCCFSLRKSANVSMITPKIRFSTIMMTMKKNSRS